MNSFPEARITAERLDIREFGFRREGTLRRAAGEDDGTLHDQAVFSLLDDEIDEI